MGAFFAIIAIVFGLPILYGIGWLIIGAIYGTKEGAIPLWRRHRKNKARQKLESHPNQQAESIDQELCNDMLDFFYERVRFYCDNHVPTGDMEEYKTSSMAYSAHRRTHNTMSSRLFQETVHEYCEKMLWGCFELSMYWDIKPNKDIILCNLPREYQTSTPDGYYEFVKQHMNAYPKPTTPEEKQQAYDNLVKPAKISSDLHSIQLHCYLDWKQYEPVLLGREVSQTPRNNPSFADDLYNKYGVRPERVQTLYDYKMQVLRQRLRSAGVSGAQTYMQSGGISQVDYNKT